MPREGVAALPANAIVRQHATDIRPITEICIPRPPPRSIHRVRENVIMKVEGKLETHKMNKRKILAAQVSRRSFLSSLGAAGVVATAGPAMAAAQTAPPMTSSDATSNESIA